MTAPTVSSVVTVTIPARVNIIAKGPRHYDATANAERAPKLFDRVLHGRLPVVYRFSLHPQQHRRELGSAIPADGAAARNYTLRRSSRLDPCGCSSGTRMSSRSTVRRFLNCTSGSSRTMLLSCGPFQPRYTSSISPASILEIAVSISSTFRLAERSSDCARSNLRLAAASIFAALSFAPLRR